MALLKFKRRSRKERKAVREAAIKISQQNQREIELERRSKYFFDSITLTPEGYTLGGPVNIDWVKGIIP